MLSNITFSPVGDQGLLVAFGRAIDETANRRVCALMAALQNIPRLQGQIREMIPAFCSLLILYDPSQISSRRLQRQVEKALRSLSSESSALRRVHYIPVCYGGAYGEDLDSVAAHSGLSPEEVVQLHCGREYRIYMLGFLPGFAYLGGLDDRLFCPRLDTPRTRIPAGSVGIGGQQTGIYPLDSPGGWRLIGRTPLRPYDPSRTPQFLYQMGDFIRFCPVDEAEYRRIEAGVQNGTYRPLVREVRS